MAWAVSSQCIWYLVQNGGEGVCGKKQGRCGRKPEEPFTFEERDRLSPLNPNYAVCLFGGGPLTKGAASHCYRLC